MPGVIFAEQIKESVPEELLKAKRRLTEKEIQILERNFNVNEDGNWNSFYVDCDAFDPDLIHNSSFRGFVVLGKLRKAQLKYHDLSLSTGIFNSSLHDVKTGDDCVIKNVSYLENYRLEERVMLFNIQEMSCTTHSRFGNGIVKAGESESTRYEIAVGNENGGRSVLPFESMIPADAYIWSKYRGDAELMKSFVRLTDYGNDKNALTYGTVSHDAVIKNTTLIKDAEIGAYAYIKGAFKLKNITVLSNEDEVSQIGEGVELVNGIMGPGSRVFYQAVGVRFVIGRNCQLKYGARLINSILGDNSTVSCCELLNNLIFPFHEQHHNSSFLIATTVMGQSNIAAGATIGSNHNSRSPDGEIIAGRGFWPGLCSDFKHSSRFASFVLASKGSYQHELDIKYPFSLLLPAEFDMGSVSIIPGWWFMYNMFAIVRNKYKFAKRDKRFTKVQHIEMDPLAPDTIQEVLSATGRLIDLTATQLDLSHQEAKDKLHKTNEEDFELKDDLCQKKYGARILKVRKAYKTYRKILKYYAVRTLIEYAEKFENGVLTGVLINRIRKEPLFKEWVNCGGQIIPEVKLFELFNLIKTEKIRQWSEVHRFYDECNEKYLEWQAGFALYILEKLYTSAAEDFTPFIYKDIRNDVTLVSMDMYESSVTSREKDFTDYYRRMPYSTKEEMEAVLGTMNDIDFLKVLKNDTEDFNEKLKDFFEGMIK